MAAALGAALVAAVLDLPGDPGRLPAAVAERAPETGATNPVTAVLLGFRAYDTWLEVAVVMAAAVAVLALARSLDVTGRPPAAADPVVAWMVVVLVPLGALVGGFLLWLGTSRPGGAFQAGSALGATALLLWLAGRRSVAALPARALGPLMAAGTAAFLVAGAAALAASGTLLRAPPGWAAEVVIGIEAAVTVAVAVTLPVMVLAAGRGAPGAGEAAG